jgi:hypothetical protein
MSTPKSPSDPAELLRLFHAWYYFDFTLRDATAERPAQKIVDDFRHQGRALAREAQRRGIDGVKILDATRRVVSRLRRATLDCGGDVEKFRGLVLSRGAGQPLREPEGTRLQLLLEGEADAIRARFKPAGEGREETGGAKDDADTRRTWNQTWCPTPRCGFDGIEYVEATEFQKRTGEKLRTIQDRIEKGKYCVSGLGKLPWCPVCKHMTPLGEGSERQHEGYTAKSQLTPIEIELMGAWANELLPKFHLAALAANFKPLPNSAARDLHAYEVRNVGALAIFDYAVKQNGGNMPQKDQAQAVAVEAMRRYLKADVDSAKRSVPHEIAEQWRADKKLQRKGDSAPVEQHGSKLGQRLIDGFDKVNRD